MLVYIAGPIDFVQRSLEDQRSRAAKCVQDAKLATYDPSKPFGAGSFAAKELVAINYAALREAAGVIAFLPSGVPTVGTPMEIQQAHDAGKPVAVIGGTGSVQLDGMFGVKKFQEDQIDEAVEWIVNAARQWRQITDVLPDEPDYLLWRGDPEFEPMRGYVGDAGFDLIVSEDVRVPYREFVDVPCGVAVQIPDGYWGMITGRSSTLRRRGLLVTQGIIDNGYRGELFAGVRNLSKTSQVVKRGERIAQLILVPLVNPTVEILRSDILDDSDRGTAGFGSTGS